MQWFERLVHVRGTQEQTNTMQVFSFIKGSIFFRPAEDSSLPLSASTLISFFFIFLQYHVKTHCMTLCWFLLDEFVHFGEYC